MGGDFVAKTKKVAGIGNLFFDIYYLSGLAKIISYRKY